MTSGTLGTTTSQSALASFYASTYFLLFGALAVYANNLTGVSTGLAAHTLLFLPIIAAFMFVLFALLVVATV